MRTHKIFAIMGSMNEESQIPTAYNLSDLTGKNSDYVHAITRQLMLAGKSDIEVKNILGELVPQILEAQKDGITARHLLGTPTDFVAKYKADPGKKKVTDYNTNMWLMLLDSFLLVFGAFAAVNGLLMMFNQGGRSYGLLTLIVAGIFGALVLYTMYRISYAPAIEGKPKLSKVKSFLYLGLSFILWLLAVAAISALIPLKFQVPIPGLLILIIALIALGGRFLLKRQLHIQPTMVGRAQLLEIQEKEGKK